MKEYKCKYCGKDDFISSKVYGAHVTNCKENPAICIRYASMVGEKIKRIPIKKICPRCNGEFVVNSTPNRVYKTKQYCSQKCSNAHGISEETKQKISNRLKERFDKFGSWGGMRKPNAIVVYCVICNTPFPKTPSTKKATCSKECKGKLLSLRMKGKTGGPRRGGGFGKHSEYLMKTGNSFHCQSTMEYQMCEILDELGLTWYRNLSGFEYITKDNNHRKYYPDFYIKDFDVYLETKGYINEEIAHKLNSSNIPNLVVVKTNKYGGNWNEIMADKNILLNMLSP